MPATPTPTPKPTPGRRRAPEDTKPADPGRPDSVDDDADVE